MLVHLYVFLIFSNLAPTLSLSPPPPTSPADPLCRPANGGSACEDEGEESADRRAGRARNTSQRKSLTPWAEAGKTVILPFFFPPPLPSLPPSLPRFVLRGSRAEPGWHRQRLRRKTAAGVCERTLDICVSARCLSDGPVSARIIYTHTHTHIFSAQT